MSDEIVNIARRIQAIAQSGIHFAHNSFDLQRYEELRELSVMLMTAVTDAPIEKIKGLFTDENGFQTPKVDVRAFVEANGKVLLAKELSDGCWSMPGGYADINYSPAQVAVKEVWEETGLDVEAVRILAVVDTNSHGFPPMEYHFYKIVVLCRVKGGTLRGSNETSEAGFFEFDSLPPLSIKRNTPQLIALAKNLSDSGATHLD